MARLRWVIPAALAIILIGAYWTLDLHLTGTFVGTGKGIVILLTTVEDISGKIRGEYREVRLNSDGSLVDTKAFVTGNGDWGAKSLTFAEFPLLPVGGTVTGNFDGQTLRITWAGRDDVAVQTLERSSLSTYQNALEQLKSQANAIKAEKAAAEIRKQQAEKLRQFGAAVKQAVSRIETEKPKLDKFTAVTSSQIEAAYKSVSGKMTICCGRNKL